MFLVAICLFFYKELLDQLKDAETPLIEGYTLIYKNTHLKMMLDSLIISTGIVNSNTQIKEINLKAVELLLQLVDVDMVPQEINFPLLFKVLGRGNIAIAKKLIDAGVDLNVCDENEKFISQFLPRWLPHSGQELLDELTAYSSEKKAKDDNKFAQELSNLLSAYEAQKQSEASRN